MRHGGPGQPGDSRWSTPASVSANGIVRLATLQLTSAAAEDQPRIAGIRPAIKSPSSSSAKRSGVEEVQLSFWQITLICFCSLYGEERIVLSPQDQGARLAGTEVLVPSVVERQFGVVIVKKVGLDRVISGTITEDLVKRPVVRTNLVRALLGVCGLTGGSSAMVAAHVR